MKLKYTLTLLVAFVGIAANADILRLHYTEFDNETQQEVERTKDYGSNNFFELVRTLRWNNSAIEYKDAVDVLSFGEEEYPCEFFDERMLSAKFKSIEFLPAKNVVLEIDAPKSIWLTYCNGKYYLDYSGKVRFADGVDTHEAVSGTVGLMNHTINWSSFNYPYILKSKPKGMSDYEETNTISFVNCSANVSSLQDDERYFNGINYTIGGSNPNEANFTLRIPALGWTPVLVVLNDEDSTCDMFNLALNNTNIDPYRGNYYYTFGLSEKEFMAGSDLPVDWMWQSELAFSEPAMLCGGSAKVAISELLIDGVSVPSEEISDYVNLEHPWEFEFNRDIKPEGMRTDIDHAFWSRCNVVYNLKKFESVGATSIRVNFKPEVDFGSNMPDWLDVMMKNITRDTFGQILNLYPNRLHIDASKCSFPDIETKEGSLEALFDNDPSTFCHSAWTHTTYRSEPYGSYIDIELDEPIQSVGFAMQAREYARPALPTKVKMYYSTDGTDWKELGETEFDAENLYSAKWEKSNAGMANYFKAPEKFRFIRWCVLESTNGPLTVSGTQYYWNLAELHFFGK